MTTKREQYLRQHYPALAPTIARLRQVQVARAGQAQTPAEQLPLIVPHPSEGRSPRLMPQRTARRARRPQ